MEISANRFIYNEKWFTLLSLNERAIVMLSSTRFTPVNERKYYKNQVCPRVILTIVLENRKKIDLGISTN